MATKFKNFLGELGVGGLILIFICGGTIMKTWVLDNDGWFLLNCGRYVFEHGIPHTEFATIHEGLYYVMHQWLTAAVFWKIYSSFGEDALIYFCWLVGVVLMWIYYKLCLYVSVGNSKISAILALTVGIIVIPLYVVTRPQIFSTLILLVEVFLLEKYFRERKIWALGILPVLSAIFVNLHAAMWAMTIIVLLPFLAESLWMRLKKNPAPVLPLIMAALGIFLAGFLNPYGLEAMTYVFRSLDPYISRMVSEMFPPSAVNLLGKAFFIWAALLIVAYSRKKMLVRYFLLSFGIMLMALQAYRSIFLFLILATFPLAFAFKDWRPFDGNSQLEPKLFLPLFLISALELWQVCDAQILELRLPLKLFLGGAAFFLTCFVFFYRREENPILRRKLIVALAVVQGIIFSLAMCSGVQEKELNVYKPAIDFLLERNRAEDIILWTGYNSGCYAEFRGIKCYLDTRAETFIRANNRKRNIFHEYFALKSGELDYKKFFARYNFTHIFVTENDMLVYQLLSHDANYRLIFEYEFPSGNEKIHARIFEPIR